MKNWVKIISYANTDIAAVRFLFSAASFLEGVNGDNRPMLTVSTIQYTYIWYAAVVVVSYPYQRVGPTSGSISTSHVDLEKKCIQA